MISLNRPFAPKSTSTMSPRHYILAICFVSAKKGLFCHSLVVFIVFVVVDVASRSSLLLALRIFLFICPSLRLSFRIGLVPSLQVVLDLFRFGNVCP